MPDTQYFTNIDGKYVKDAEARQQLNDLEDYVESLDQPWTPLQDGYSNFWFELTNETLSPWLNFSAKTESAVIDWGDGSGEQSLDTLTPTHTYSKAGKYVVKVKGVTGISAQFNAPFNSDYTTSLNYAELNSEVTTLSMFSFRFCSNLKRIIASNLINIGAYSFNYCTSLSSVNSKDLTNLTAQSVFLYCVALNDVALTTALTEIGANVFNGCVGLSEIIIPSSVTALGNGCFANCYSLQEIHIQATIPPTAGTNMFQNSYANYIIYVPVGYGDTYKSDTGWSTYADHILEEGQTPNRMMLAKFKEETDEPQDDMR